MFANIHNFVKYFNTLYLNTKASLRNCKCIYHVSAKSYNYSRRFVLKLIQSGIIVINNLTLF